MPRSTAPPLPPDRLADLYFIENRTRLLDVAAFLDRIGRAQGDEDDVRVAALRAALRLVADADGTDRVARLQMLFSDRTEKPLDALDQKSAVGVYARWHDQVAP